MSKEKFTDEDFQNYVDDAFDGDKPALEKKIIRETPAAQAQVVAYRQLIEMINGQVQPELSFHLATAVLRRMKAKRDTVRPLPSRQPFLLWVAIALTFIVLLLFWLFGKLFYAAAQPAFFLAVCGSVCVGICSFHLPEVAIRKRIVQA